jgi:hypothetical protein
MIINRGQQGTGGAVDRALHHKTIIYIQTFAFLSSIAVNPCLAKRERQKGKWRKRDR